MARARLPERDLFQGMNKTEKKRAIELEALKRSGQIREWAYEKVTLKLADDCRYTPDFMVIDNEGWLRFEETKGGYIREDAMIKLRMAATVFPAKFLLYQLNAGSWTVTEVKSA